MPRFPESDNGSDARIFKICKIYAPLNLAAAIDRSGDFIAPMKRSIRPLFSLLLLIVFAVTLTYRTVVRGIGFGSIYGSNVSVSPPQVPVFNSTLLNWAAIDAGEEKAKKQIEELLEGNFASVGRFRTYAYLRRLNNRDIRTKPSAGLPPILRSPKFYRYWLAFRKVLHDWARDKRFQPEIMSELPKLVKQPLDRHNGVIVDKKRYSSCAIVGNSGILLESDYGRLIDSHEIVIRLNNARVDKFERNVGSKTNVSFVNSNILHLCGRREGCFCHPYGQNVPIIMYICQPVHFLDYTICNSSHKAPLLITDPRFDVLCARIVKYYSLKRFIEETGKSLDEWVPSHDGSMFHYSSGMQAIMMALGICDKVSIFGFGKSTLAKHHYHTNQKAELRLHDYEAEYDLYRDLVERPWAIPFISDKFKIPPVVIHH